jgi:hypothetical protein
MPATTSAEASLINDAEFLDESAAESNFSLIAAALVLAACLSAGAATAAYVFHDQLTHVTERLSANR